MIQIAERITVPDAWDMDDDTFVKHMNLRHTRSLGGLDALHLKYISSYVMWCYRLFHDQLHLWRIDLDHEHLDK